MSDNDIIILNSIIEQSKSKIGATLTDSDYFNIFTFEQILKDFDLSYDELSAGDIDSGDDGGIDGIFVFINGELLDEDTDLEGVRKNPLFEVFLIQSKTSNSFQETAIEKVIATTRNVLDLTKDMNVLKNLYNAELVKKVTGFRNAFVKLAALYPVLKFNFFYASKGDTSNIHPKVEGQARILEETIKQFFRGSDVLIEFMGARELLDASRLEKSYTLQLQFLENYLSRGADNYVVLCSLTDYYKFVTDGKNNLRRYIFESNVRDYQGNVEVNRDIQKTLYSDDYMDFWWLNNGITILASKASITGKTITLDNVQIVNGLQTTAVIYNCLKDNIESEERNSRRSLLVRIIVTDNPEARDRIIKATNFQTAIPAASLRATDRIQRNIEDFILHQGWFYDRRKNYYKNLGKPIDKIISIPYLAQAVMAVVLKEPDNARARPTSLIKRDVDYTRVFTDDIPPSVYLSCARLMKRIDTFIRFDFSNHTWQERSDLKYHFCMVTNAVISGTTNYSIQDIDSLDIQSITDELLTKCLNKTMDIAREFSQQKGWSIERLAKNRDFVNYLLDNIDIS